MSSRRLPRVLPAALVAVALCLPATLSLAAAPAAHATPPPPSHVPALVRAMTIEEKVGQLFIGYAHGATADTKLPEDVEQNRKLFGADNAAALIATHHVGGMIYFGNRGNVKDVTQVARLSNDLQASATTTGAEIPLLISTDEEGGYVTRMPAPFASSPGNMTIGAGFSAERAYTTARAMGEQLRALGIRVNNAPVIDVNTNPENRAVEARAYSDDTAQVSAYGGEAVHGLQQGGVAATVKHFPGLGSVRANTDDEISVSDQTKDEFAEHDLPAFATAIEAGTDSVMVGHLIAPGLDPTRAPASLSSPIVTGLLRTELGFDGVVVTDALNAGALSGYADGTLAVRAIQAGVDQLLMPRYLPDAVDAVIGAVESGRISKQRIDTSVTRILNLKQKLGLFDDHTVDEGAVLSLVGTPAQVATMAEAARSGVTLHRTGGTLPFAATPDSRIAVIGWGVNATTNLTKLLADRGYDSRRVHTGDDPDDATIANAVSKAKHRDLAIVLSRGPWTTDAQKKLITRIHDTGVPTVVLSVGAPYELAALPEDLAFISAYGYQPPSLAAAVHVIFGEQPLGRSPITITAPDGRVVAPYRSGMRYDELLVK
jgi:beta-N-acetylhexosaminidase